MTLKKWILLGLASLALLGLYASPYLALHEIRAAAAAHDAEKLAGYVDFTSVRASLKTGVQARLAGQQRNEAGDPTPASAMGAAVAGALLGPMVDALITPESLSRVLQGQRPAAAVVGGITGSTGAKSPAEPLETQMGYESPNRFVFSVRKQGEDEEPVDLVLRRDGVVSWKLAELRLP
jgi:hypothetical protein